jgi:serine protease Do
LRAIDLSLNRSGWHDLVVALAVVLIGLCAGLSATRATADDAAAAVGIAKLVEQVKPSVVVVTFTGRNGDQQGLGSGFVVDAEGLIATNLHVLGEGRPISVRMLDGTEYAVRAVHATDRARDLAILQIDAADLPALELGDSDSLQQGESVIAIGNPLGLQHSVVQGVISAVREDVDGQPMIQLAIPIERGNSGGPVVDRSGRVLGVVSLKSQVAQNLGYAVGVNALKSLLQDPNPVPMSRWLTIGRLNARQWQTPDDVRWRQRAGRIHVEGRASGLGGRSLIFSRQPLPESPFEVAVWVKLDQQDGAAGLIFYADGKDKHYGFYPSNGKLRFSRFDGPSVYSWQVLGEKRVPEYRPEEWNRLKVRLEDGLIQCYCNEALVFESRDTAYTSGQVGLAKFRHTTASFKGFAVGREIPTPIPPPEFRAAIVALMDDLPLARPADQRLIDEVLEISESQSSSAATVLRDEAQRLQQHAERMRQLADAVHAEAVTRRLAELFADEARPRDLVHAALLVAALDNDELDVGSYQKLVDEMAGDIRDRLAEPDEGSDADASNADTSPADANTDDDDDRRDSGGKRDNTAKRQALHRYLFDEQGFHGSRTNYGSASNSYLNEVIDDREGLPITLSVLYLGLAERIGLPADGIGLPGHFVVRVRSGEQWQLVDVFERGELLSLPEAKARIEQTDEWSDAFLEPQSPRAIVVRMLRNLINTANTSDDVEAALRYVSALLVLEPDSAIDRMYRAVLCYNTRRVAQGLAEVDWLLERQPEEIPEFRLQQLRELIQALEASE